MSRTALALARSANCSEDPLDIAAVAPSALCRTHTDDESARRFLIARGTGGTGRRHVINIVVRTLARKIFGLAGARAVAVPNSMTRIIGDDSSATYAALPGKPRQLLDTRSLSADHAQGRAIARMGARQAPNHRRNVDGVSCPAQRALLPHKSCAKTTHGLNLTTYRGNLSSETCQ